MPTKREILKEKTVKELEEMARDKNLSGYTTVNKPDLIDMVMDSYRKYEIESWSEEEETQPKEQEEEPTEIEEREGEEEITQEIEDLKEKVSGKEEVSEEIGREAPTEKEGIDSLTVIAVIVLIVIIISTILIVI